MIHHVYSSLTRLSWPYLRILPYIRSRRGKEVKDRIEERFGKTNHPKPDTKLIWIHAASNGETLSALPLIQHLQSLPSVPHILVTTMTVTAANLIKQRTDAEHVTHQFIPYDHPDFIKRFHDHWSPDMAIWIESELWPNHLKTLKNNNVPAVLLNARLSDNSVKNWARVKASFQNLLSCFDVILAQTKRDQNNLNQLGINNVAVEGNLKNLALPLPFDEFALEDMQNCVGNRPVLLFASTHSPEENIAASIHQSLKSEIPDLLTIIVPRHPARGEEIAMDLKSDECQVALRSLKMSPRPGTDIYVADTLGELGVFYSLCEIVFIGNSLGIKPGGGHNLMEPAWFACAVVSGNDLHNFSVQAEEMPKAQACKIVSNENELQNTLKALLEDKDCRQIMGENAYKYVSSQQEAGLDNILKTIEPSCKTAGLL